MVVMAKVATTFTKFTRRNFIFNSQMRMKMKRWPLANDSVRDSRAMKTSSRMRRKRSRFGRVQGQERSNLSSLR